LLNLGLLEVGNCLFQHGYGIVEHAQTTITLVTQEAANRVSPMAMVYGKHFEATRICRPAYGAQAILSLEHPMVIFGRETT
jgi:hypothetical protein